jgi:hypothetical protein
MISLCLSALYLAALKKNGKESGSDPSCRFPQLISLPKTCDASALICATLARRPAFSGLHACRARRNSARLIDGHMYFARMPHPQATCNATA